MTGPYDMVTFFHITDTHLRPPGELVAGGIDPARQLQDILDRIEESGVVPAALLLTGDLADSGEPGAYALLRELVEPVAARLGCAVVQLPGNHDDRAAFATGLLDRPADGPLDEPLDQVVEIAGIRIVALDSSVPGKPYGALLPDRLSALRTELATPAPFGTLVLLHHPPVRSPLPTIDAMRLREPEQLAAAISGSDVRMIVCGHNHYAATGVLAGVPVWIGPASVNRSDTTPPAGTARSTATGGFSRIDVFADQAVAVALPAWPEPSAFELSAAQLEEFLASCR